jgi:riboflavin kinase/FMN adenylyltransferase
LIRELIQTGKVSAASLLLGRDHEIVGTIEHGRKLGRTIGFPTANFSRSSIGLLPQDGVYAGWLIADGVRYPAAHSVGTNDSVGEVPRLIESHVIGRDDLDLYDKQCTALIHAQIRPWAKFDSLDALIAQINDDVLAAREILESIDA